MYNAYTLKNGRITSIQAPQVKKQKSLVWVRCIKPTEAEVAWLSDISRAPEEEMRETIEGEERPKLVVAKYLELIFGAPFREDGEDGEFTTVPLYFYINGNILLTIEKEQVQPLNDIEEIVKTNKRKFLFTRPVGNFIFYVLDAIQDRYLHLIEKFSRRVDLFEEKGMFTREHMDQVYDVSVTLAYFNQALLANIEVLNTLRKCYFKGFSDHDRMLFGELYDDALMLRDTERVQRDIITNLFDLQSLINTNRLNIFMKKLTSLALIIMVPTFITGMYGMNFAYMPFAQHPRGFFIITGFMLLVSLGLVGFFHWLDWL